MEKTMKARKIPSTDSIEELARFWDSHDLTEFADQLEEVGDSAFKRVPSTAVVVHLRPDEAKAVKQAAKNKRVREATLLRRWVIEKLHASTLAARRR
jgi:predicted phosphatase